MARVLYQGVEKGETTLKFHKFLTQEGQAGAVSKDYLEPELESGEAVKLLSAEDKGRRTRVMPANLDIGMS